jgi:hypothetical protein
MATHQEKVRVTVECSPEERTYIKMLAAKNHMTISEYLLSFARHEMPSHENVPNAVTRKAMKDADEKRNLESFDNIDDFWKAMGIDPHA